MLSLLLLLGVAGWIAWPYLRERQEVRQEDARLAGKITARRALLARMPDSPAAQEALGDALREAGRAQEALACYRRALELEARTQTSGGVFASGGLQNKLRLAESDAARGGGPAFGETLATRQQVCRQCGALSGPQEPACATCGAPLPVDRFFDTIRANHLRPGIVRESVEALTMMGVVLIALVIASWMPIEIKACLILSTAMVLAWRFLKRLGDG